MSRSIGIGRFINLTWFLTGNSLVKMCISHFVEFVDSRISSGNLLLPSEDRVLPEAENTYTFEEKWNTDSIASSLTKSTVSIEPLKTPSAADRSDVIAGAKLVKNTLDFLKQAASVTTKAGEVWKQKVVFLCLSQIVDDDGEMMYVGHIMAAEEGSYLHSMASKPKLKYVKVREGGMSISLPLVFPRPADLFKCQKFGGRTTIARETNFCVLRKTNSDNLDRAEASSTKLSARAIGSVSASKCDSPLGSPSDATVRRSASDGMVSWAAKSRSVSPQKSTKELKAAICTQIQIKAEDRQLPPEVGSDTVKQIVVSDLKASPPSSNIVAALPNDSTKSHFVLASSPSSLSTGLDKVISKSDLITKSSPTAVAELCAPSSLTAAKHDTDLEKVDVLFDKFDFPQITEVQAKVKDSGVGVLVGVSAAEETTLPYKLESDIITFESAVELADVQPDSPLIKEHSTVRNTDSENADTKKSASRRTTNCGSCDGCKAANCRQCMFCKDMVKYGGIGRLKQRCMLRKCQRKSTKDPKDKQGKQGKQVSRKITSWSTGKRGRPSSLDKQVSATFKTSMGRPSLLDKEAIFKERTPVGRLNYLDKQAKAEKQSTVVYFDPASSSIQIMKASSGQRSEQVDESDNEDQTPTPRAYVPVVETKRKRSSYQAKLRAAGLKVRKFPDCGHCDLCLDKKRFGGLGKKKQMCRNKQAQLKRMMANMEDEDLDHSTCSESDDLPSQGRISSRKRKLTQKMEESMDQDWSGAANHSYL